MMPLKKRHFSGKCVLTELPVIRSPSFSLSFVAVAAILAGLCMEPGSWHKPIKYLLN